MSAGTVFKFSLYIAGDGSNSALALANLTALCKKYLRNCHEIEVIDVFLDPKRALADAIFLTPTLVKVMPLPERTIVGTLSRIEPVLHALGLLVPAS